MRSSRFPHPLARPARRPAPGPLALAGGALAACCLVGLLVAGLARGGLR